MMVSKRNHLFQGLLFRFHVKFQGCNGFSPTSDDEQKPLVRLQTMVFFLLTSIGFKWWLESQGLEFWRIWVSSRDERFHPWHSMVYLVGGWTNPFEKYARPIGSSPQVGVNIKKIFELPPPSILDFFVYVEMYTFWDWRINPAFSWRNPWRIYGNLLSCILIYV